MCLPKGYGFGPGIRRHLLRPTDDGYCTLNTSTTRCLPATVRVGNISSFYLFLFPFFFPFFLVFVVEYTRFAFQPCAHSHVAAINSTCWQYFSLFLFPFFFPFFLVFVVEYTVRLSTLCALARGCYQPSGGTGHTPRRFNRLPATLLQRLQHARAFTHIHLHSHSDADARTHPHLHLPLHPHPHLQLYPHPPTHTRTSPPHAHAHAHAHADNIDARTFTRGIEQRVTPTKPASTWPVIIMKITPSATGCMSSVSIQPRPFLVVSYFLFSRCCALKIDDGFDYTTPSSGQERVYVHQCRRQQSEV